jgi:hypothetical protein
MKTIFRFLGLAVLMSGFAVAGVTSAFAQDPAATPAPAGPCENLDAANALYAKVTDNYAHKDWKVRQIAVDSGEEYLKIYGACAPFEAQVNYIKGALDGWKKSIEAQKIAERRKELLSRFDPAVPAGNWDVAYATGKEIVAIDPETAFNQILVMGSIGLDETLKNPRVTKYNDDTLKFAKMAIEKLNAGKTSKTFGYDKFAYGVKTKPEDKEVNPALSKENALGWMNYTIGAILYFDKNNKKEALSYLYKAAQANSQTQKLPQIYGILGDYYFDEVVRLGDEIKKKTEEMQGKEPEEAKALLEQTRTLISQQKAYDERGIDAYGRAQKLIPANDARQKAYRDGIGSRIETLYKVRFEKVDGLQAFVAAQIAKPLPDPTTVPAPIVEAEPTSPTTTGTNPTAVPAANGTKPVAPGTVKPVTAPATNGTKPAATPATTTKKPVSVNGTTTGATTAAVKPAAKKPVVKKKGTR